MELPSPTALSYIVMLDSAVHSYIAIVAEVEAHFPVRARHFAFNDAITAADTGLAVQQSKPAIASQEYLCKTIRYVLWRAQVEAGYELTASCLPHSSSSGGRGNFSTIVWQRQRRILVVGLIKEATGV